MLVKRTRVELRLFCVNLNCEAFYQLWFNTCFKQPLLEVHFRSPKLQSQCVRVWGNKQCCTVVVVCFPTVLRLRPFQSVICLLSHWSGWRRMGIQCLERRGGRRAHTETEGYLYFSHILECTIAC